MLDTYTLKRSVPHPPLDPRLPKLGRGVNHDSRSRLFPYSTAGQTLVSAHHERHIPVLDQGNLGSCFPPGTRVRMGDGSERRIEDVRLGEYVVTAEGNTGRVTRTLLRDEHSGLVRLSLWGHAHLRMTREHPVLTARGYIAANDLCIGDEVAMPRYMAEVQAVAISPRSMVRRYKVGAHLLPEKIELTPKFGRLFGLWLAEGSADGSKIRWTFGAHEIDTLVPETVRLCQETLGVTAHVAVRPNNSIWVTVYGIPWSDLFKVLGGHRAEFKAPHADLCSGSPEFLASVLDGWLAGDGCYRKDGSSEGVTVSSDLALAMYDIGQALGRHPVIDWRASTQNKSARSRLPRWTITFAPGEGRCRQNEKHVWRKIRAITLEEYVGPVYDLTVEGDHSYVAEGIGVHNCTGNAGIGLLGTGVFFTDRGSHYSLDEQGAVQLYSDATNIDPYNGAYPPTDTGSDGLSIAKSLKKYGEIAGYTHTFNLQDALVAISQQPVIIGINWYQSMFDVDGDGRINIGGQLAGGHEIVIDQIIVDVDQVWFTNSWGTNWGRSGRAYLTFDDLGRLLDEEGDVTVPTPLSQPAPTPTPPAPPTPPQPTPSPDPADVELAAAQKKWLAAKGL